MPPADDAHSLTIQLATALKERDEARAKQSGWLATITQMHEEVAGLRELLATCEQCAENRVGRNQAEKEANRLRTALTEVNNLLMSVPQHEDWRQIVREKVVVALYGEAAWEETT